MSVCGLNLKPRSYRNFLGKQNCQMGSCPQLTSNTSSTSAKLGKDWITQVNQRNWFATRHFRTLLLSQPRPPSTRAYSWGILFKPPGISCIPDVDTTWQSAPLPHLSWETPASSVSNCTPYPPLFPLPPTPLFFFFKLNYSRTNYQFTSSPRVILTSSLLVVS